MNYFRVPINGDMKKTGNNVQQRSEKTKQWKADTHLNHLNTHSPLFTPLRNNI